MKHWLFILLLTPLFANNPAPVEYVDAKAFSGLWYEVARTYNRYEKDCVAATVEYILQPDNKYKVYNRCFDKTIGGELIEYKGSAKPLKGKSMSQMKVTYFLIFSDEYRVIYLDEDYSSSIVCDTKMDKVWIMHRKPTMPKNKLEEILAKLEQNMDLKRLIYTPQDKEGRYK